MKQFSVHPALTACDSCEEFAAFAAPAADDLILTNRYIFEPAFARFGFPCDVLYQEDYGTGEPSDEMFYAILRDIKRDYRRIIAIGGGTVLDLGKLLSLKNRDALAALFSGETAPVKAAELIAVPTTCGTGSEVTNIAVLALHALGTKKGLAHDALLPDRVILLPALLEGLPFRFFATSSIDALIHAIESILSPKSTVFSRTFGYRALDILLTGYQKIAAHGEDARFPLLGDFLCAATMAGISFGNAGCGTVHALSYPLGAKYHVPHGESNYAIFPGVMRCYAAEGDPSGEFSALRDVLAARLNCPKDRVFPELASLLDAILPHRPLHCYGMTEEDIPVFTVSVEAGQQRLLSNSYVPMTAARIEAIYRGLF